MMHNILEQCLNTLQKGGTILYPTDTIWGIGCDALNEKSIARIYNIKKRSPEKKLIILVSSEKMLRTYVPHIPETVLHFLKDNKRPTTVVYENPKRLPPALIAKDNTIAIRIVQHTFCKELIERLGNPLVSTSANISGSTNPKNFGEIDISIKNEVNHIVGIEKEKENSMPSKIARFTNGKLEIMRA